MNDQVPLYLGIPLAGLCIIAVIAVAVFIIAVLRGKA